MLQVVGGPLNLEESLGRFLDLVAPVPEAAVSSGNRGAVSASGSGLPDRGLAPAAGGDEARRVRDLAIGAIERLSAMLPFIRDGGAEVRPPLLRAVGELIGEIDMQVIVPLGRLYPELDDLRE